MMRRETRIRKASWDRVAMLFETTFKFKKGTGSKVRKHNKILYLALMTDFGFYYLVRCILLLGILLIMC